MNIAGNRPNDQSIAGRALDPHAADALARAADLWERRLAEEWTPPEGSEFPWAMVRLSLAALLPGLREWGRKGSPLPPAPSPRFAGGEGESYQCQTLPLAEANSDTQTPPLPQRSGERGQGGEGNQAKRIALILAGNTPLLAWSPLAACLLAGHTVHVKMSQGETLWPRLFRDALAQVAPLVAERIRLDVWPGDDPRTGALIASADAVIAYGSDETIATLRALTPKETPFFGFGHAISIGLIMPDFVVEQVKLFARDVLMYDQSGCLSPHILLYDHRDCSPLLGKDVMAAAFYEADFLEVPPVTEPAAAIAIRRARDLAYFDGCDVRPFPEGSPSEDNELRWTVIWDYESVSTWPTPIGYGVVYLVPYTDLIAEWKERLGTLRGRVSSVGVTGTLPDELRAFLTVEGVSRICAPGEMQTPPLDWPNGNIDLLAELLHL